MEVYDALYILRRHCENQQKCCKCILHKPDDPDSCAIAEYGCTPSRWKLDREIKQPLIVKSIFKK